MAPKLILKEACDGRNTNRYFPKPTLLIASKIAVLNLSDNFLYVGRSNYHPNDHIADNDESEENLKIGEDALHIVVEEFSAGSKQESQGEAEYHLVVVDMRFMKEKMMLVVMRF